MMKRMSRVNDWMHVQYEKLCEKNWFRFLMLVCFIIAYWGMCLPGWDR